MSSTPSIPDAGAWDPSPGAAGEGGFSPYDPSATTGGALPGASIGADDSSAFALPEPGSAGSAAPMIRPTSAPTGYLYISLAAAAVALILTAVSASAVAAVLAWGLSVILGLGMGMIFLVKDKARQTSPWYNTASALPGVLYRVSVVASIVGIVAASARFALFVGRM